MFCQTFIMQSGSDVVVLSKPDKVFKGIISTFQPCLTTDPITYNNLYNKGHHVFSLNLSCPIHAIHRAAGVNPKAGGTSLFVSQKDLGTKSLVRALLQGSSPLPSGGELP